MGIFDRFPYSSTHEMNLDFMLGKATEIAEDMQTVTTGMAQVQAGLSAISEKTEQATQAAAQAAQSASSIEGSVAAAEEAAEEAQTHNESAQTWANNALTYKADCQRAATEAAASSSSAAQAATAAAASEDTVATYAQAANASAQSAANNNDSAHQYANQASASASNATFHSSNAQTAATNAQTAATNANTSATNASASADRAATLKTDVETLHRMCVAAVDQAAEQAVAAGNSAGQAAATKTEVENLVESLPEDFTDLNNTVNQLSDEIDDLISGGMSSNAIPHEPLIQGTYKEGDTVGTPTGGGGAYRATVDRTFAFSLLDETNFVFNGGGLYSVAFVGFDADGNCISTPIAWLADGSYTKSQVMSNCRGSTNTVGFAFQFKANTSATPVPLEYMDEWCSIITTVTIDGSGLTDGSVTEEKLSNAVREKLNGETVNTVDVIMFMGQSNMAGRGEVANAPTLIPGAGYEYRAISAPNSLSPMVEPFGVTENNPNGINEGSSKTGSMVVAFTNAYYTHNGRIPVIGISASKGGTPISDWQSGGAYLTDAIARLSSCVTYLSSNGYTIRHKYILWCQGETDGDDGTTSATYKTLFDSMLSTMKAQGIEKLFMVRIGNYNSGSSTKYNVIMDAQTEIAQTNADVVMASTDFAGMRERGLMKDAFHYYQEAYNEVGTYSGINVAEYVNTGKEPTMYDTQDGSLYYSHKN